MPVNLRSGRHLTWLARADRGESLIETILTIVIISVTVTALVSSLGTAANASNSQRASVTADAVMRNFAEATKAGARTCTVGSTYAVTYTPPSGWSVATSPTGNACPAVSTTQLLTLTVTGPNSRTSTMQLRVRTP